MYQLYVMTHVIKLSIIGTNFLDGRSYTVVSIGDTEKELRKENT